MYSESYFSTVLDKYTFPQKESNRARCDYRLCYTSLTLDHQEPPKLVIHFNVLSRLHSGRFKGALLCS